MTDFTDATLAVSGAGGHLGRRTVELLLQGGARHIVALTRDPSKLADLKAKGVEVRAASFDQPDSLPAAFAGVERLLIISTNDLERRRRQQVGAVDAAVAAGVRHLLYTSITSPYPDRSAAALVPDSHYWTEIRIAASGRDFTLLRNNLYADFQIPAAQHAVATGTLYHAAGAGGRAFVTREDCAAAAAGALLRAEGQRIYDISGPEALSADDLAALFSTLSGKPVKAQAVSGADLVAGLKAGGVPAEMAAVLATFETDAAKGLLGIVSNAVEELTGRPPQSVADYLSANKAALAG